MIFIIRRSMSIKLKILYVITKNHDFTERKLSGIPLNLSEESAEKEYNWV